jgi:hypothetical protein
VDSTEACETHPGQDGVGACRAGQRQCVVAADRKTSDWGSCQGSIGPAQADSCANPGDDANCDGTPNGGCPCVDGETRPCGPSTDTGICAFGVSSCVNQVLTACVGATLPTTRNCASNQDNDCDGIADNTLDSVCTCAVGDQQVCGEHPGQDGKGRCQAGTRTCEVGLNGTSTRFGACTGSVAPLATDLCNVRGDDSNCDGVPNGGCQCVTGDRSTCGQQYQSLGVCSSRTLVCGSDGRWPPASSCAPTGPEICNNNLDDDCDGQVDDRDVCQQCTPGESTCVDNQTSNVCSTTGTFVRTSCPVQCAGGRCVDPVHDPALLGCNKTSQIVCNTNAQTCCELRDPPDGTIAIDNAVFGSPKCVPSSTSCPERFAECDGPSDCPSTQVCCFQTSAGASSLTCRSAADCTNPPVTGVQGVGGLGLSVVCDPVNPNCPAGSRCVQNAILFMDMTFYTCR